VPEFRFARSIVQSKPPAPASCDVRTAPLNKAFDKGKLKHSADAQLLMGMALYNLKKLREARGWFVRALRDKKARDQASGWIRYIDAELRGG